MLIVLILYSLTLLGLTIYLQRSVLVSIYAKVQKGADLPDVAEADLPAITVQLPIYNEQQVALRVIDAACNLDYPRDRLQIQVLDDSTDSTTDLIAQSVRRWQQAGLTIVHCRRPTRQGQKAGNLAHGLPHATGEFIAIFDADFVPNRAWLRHTVAHFFRAGSSRLGLVQTRWDYLNTHESWLTYAQMLTFEEFGMAQVARGRLELFISFFGTAGLWRRACIEAVGGWSVDTISEDLDLAYRAQLAGWQLAYDDTALASAELPNRMLVYKQQQFYWAKGGIQATRKLLGPLLDASVSWVKKVDALLFATWPVHHLLLVVLLLLRLPQLIWPTPLTIYLDAFVLVGLLGVIVPSLVDWLQGKHRVPLQLVLQVGVAPNNTYAVLAGLFGSRDGNRTRTPKTGETQTQSAYPIAPDWIILVELGLTLVVLAGFLLALYQQQWLVLPLLLLYLLGLGWVSGQSAWEGLQWYRGSKANSRTTRDTLFPLPLTAFEEYLLRENRPSYPMTAMYRLRFSGFLEPAAFQAAVETVMQRHPLFRATVRRTRFGRHIWVEHPNWQPVIHWQPQTNPDGFPPLVHFDLSQEPGIQWWVLARDDGHDLVIQAHHCCSDGVGGGVVAEDLLIAYNSNLGMKNGSGSLRPLDPHRLGRRGAPKLASGMSLKLAAGQLVGAIGVIEFVTRSPAPLAGANHLIASSTVPSDRVSKIQVIEFDPDETKTIRAAAKSHRVTMNVLLLQNLFLALGAWRQKRGIGRYQDWLRIGLPINLRGAADKAMPAANSVSMVFLDRPASQLKDDTHLLRGIYKQLWRIKRFQLQYTYLLSLGAARLLPSLMTRITRADTCYQTTYLSNLGVVLAQTPLPQREGRIVCGNVELTSVDIASPLQPQTHAGFLAYIYAGRLRISLHYNTRVLSAEQADDLLETIRRQVRQSIQDKRLNS